MITENATAAGTAVLPAANELESVFGGKVHIEGSPSYESLRKIWNGMIDRRPAIIAQCINNEDIKHAIEAAKKYKLVISVRAGGHNISGSAVCDDGIMIDLSLMKSVKVVPEESIAFVEGGATWGDFDKAAQEFGLATTGGLISTTGVAGLTLGGGVGWLVRKYG
ncbi:MAG: FAD-binding oxidoreductase, partial [Methanosarcinales archaeon]